MEEIIVDVLNVYDCHLKTEELTLTKSNESERYAQMVKQSEANARVYGPIFSDLKDCPEVSLRQIKERVRAHKKKLGWAIRFMQSNGRRVRVDRDRFVKNSLITWDKPGIEAAIDRLCISNVLPLGAVQDFSGFPEVPGYPWTLCLLHHYVEYVSTTDGKFVIHGVSFASVKVSGLIVRKDTDEEWDWDLAFARAAIEAGIKPDADAVGKFLLGQRCIAGKSLARQQHVAEKMTEITGGEGKRL